MTLIPLAIPTADNTVITADTLNFTCDGANLINGGATDLRLPKSLSRTVSVSVGIIVKNQLPILYPPQTFYVKGTPVVL